MWNAEINACKYGDRFQQGKRDFMRRRAAKQHLLYRANNIAAFHLGSIVVHPPFIACHVGFIQACHVGFIQACHFGFICVRN
jgi:hypothetical protein